MRKINDQLEVLKRLNSFSLCFGKITTIEELASRVGEVLEDLLAFDSFGLYLYMFHENRLKLLTTKGFSDEERAEADKKAMDRHPGFMFETGQVLILPEPKNDSLNQTPSVFSGFCFPVINKTEPVAEFCFFSRKNNFNEEDEIILSLICSIAGAIYALSDLSASPKRKSADPVKHSLQYDLSKLSKLVGDDKHEIVYLLGQFVELIPEYSAVLFTAFEQDNIGEVEKSAHKIKASLELIASGNLCSNIKLINEYAKKKENLDKLPKLVKYYRENVAILISQLSVKLAELKKGDA